MTAAEAYAHLKPKMRGWLHAGAIPAAVTGGLALVVLAPPELRLPVAVYAICTVALFSISATFHRGHWGRRMHGVLQRLDHATIFIFIAGTYTPYVATVVTGRSGSILLWAVWIFALLGVVFRVAWIGAPRWLTVPVYIALGWAAVFVMPTIWTNGGVAIFMLMLTGGILYSTGAVIYALRRPDPSPKWFGFHEVFHSFTLGGFVTHYIGICLAVFGAGAAAATV